MWALCKGYTDRSVLSSSILLCVNDYYWTQLPSETARRQNVQDNELIQLIYITHSANLHLQKQVHLGLHVHSHYHWHWNWVAHCSRCVALQGTQKNFLARRAAL